MNVKIQSVHFDADQRLIDFVEERVHKLGHFHDGIVGADVILKLEKSSTSDNKVAEIRVEVRGNDLFAKRQCKSFEEAIDMCTDALKSQVKKQKDKLRRT